MKLNFFAILFFLSVLLLCAAISEATSISSGMDDGYSAKVLEKVLKNFNPATTLRDRSGISLQIFVDGDGKYSKSIIRSSSGSKDVDDEFVKAIGKSSPFGQPPYGQPSEITLTFKNDASIQKNGAVTQEKAKKPEVAKVIAMDNTQKEKYIHTITKEIRNSVYIPAEAKKGTYMPIASVRIDKNGNILSSAIVKSSGDKNVDKYLLQGIKRANKVSIPPAALPQELELTFKLVR